MKQQPITMPMTIISFERILKSEFPVYAWPVYTYYCWKAMQKKTNYLDLSYDNITTRDVAKGLKCSEDKIIKARKVLLELGLIETFIKRNETKTAILGNFIKVNYMNKKDETWSGSFVGGTELRGAQNCQYNNNSTKSNNNTNTKKIKEEILLNNNTPCEGKIFRKRRELEPTNKEQLLLDQIKELKEQNELLFSQLKTSQPIQPIQLDLFPKDKLITENDFEPFYDLYPRPVNKGKSKKAWENLCILKSKANKRPTWKVVRTALKGQIESELWTKKPEMIPHTTTWINEYGWLTLPEDLVVYKEFEKKTFTKPKNNNLSQGFVGSPIDVMAVNKEFMENRERDKKYLERFDKMHNIKKS